MINIMYMLLVVPQAEQIEASEIRPAIVKTTTESSLQISSRNTSSSVSNKKHNYTDDEIEAMILRDQKDIIAKKIKCYSNVESCFKFINYGIMLSNSIVSGLTINDHYRNNKYLNIASLVLSSTVPIVSHIEFNLLERISNLKKYYTAGLNISYQ